MSSAAQAAFLSVLPVLVAGGFGLVLALAEIFLAFGADSWKALHNRWSWRIVLANILTATIVCAVVLFLIRPTGPRLLTAVVVGLTFPTILRTRFTWFAGQVALLSAESAAKEFSLGLDRVYRQWLEICYEKVSFILANERMMKAVSFPTSMTQVFSRG